VLKLLQDPNLTWATKLDLQSWFHNLAVHNKTARWMRFQHCQVGYQIQAMPFGWNLSSLWSHLMYQSIKAKLHQMGIQLAWFLDNIFILGTSAEGANMDKTTGRPSSALGFVLAGDMPKVWQTEPAGVRLLLFKMPNPQTG
jgi:hypothetical protein